MAKHYMLLSMLSVALAFGGKISIELDPQSRRIPATLEPISAKGEERQSAYQRSLEKVFRFDMHHLGKLLLVDPITNTKLSVSAAGDGYPLSTGESAKPHMRLRPKIQEGTLTLECLRDGGSTSFSAPLTGITLRDRERIHQICDKVHEMLFQMPRVASRKIAYTLKVKDTSHPKGYRAEIWQSDWDGAGAKRLSSPRDFSLTPIYVPNKPQLLYVNYRTGLAKIHVLDTQNKTTRPLLKLRGNQMLPALSKDGSWLAFVSDAMGSMDLFVHGLRSGGKPARFSFGKNVTHATPTFSPNADRIAFVSDKSGVPQIYIADLDLTHPIRAKLLSDKNRQNTCPAWSPDGTKLVYVGKVDGARQLWLYDFKTNSERQLTRDPIHKECPAWAPDSEHIVYNTAEGSELFVYSTLTGESVRISRNGGEKKFPTWQP
jgi:TolB protein